MRKSLTCQTPSRLIRVAWISLHPKGDVSFGINDKTYISPKFKVRQFVWSAYNRITSAFMVPSYKNSLEQVKNPHFTFHYPFYFHLKSNKDRVKDDDELFAGICDVNIVLYQQKEMPWIRATTGSLCDLKSAGTRLSNIPHDDLLLSVPTENVSIQIAVDFIRSGANPIPDASTWYLPGRDMVIRIRAYMTCPQLATLAWFHAF